jgi:hypothetical protein
MYLLDNAGRLQVLHKLLIERLQLVRAQLQGLHVGAELVLDLHSHRVVRNRGQFHFQYDFGNKNAPNRQIADQLDSGLIPILIFFTNLFDDWTNFN